MLLFHAPPDGARGIEVTSGLEQRYEPDRRVRVAAPARPLHSAESEPAISRLDARSTPRRNAAAGWPAASASA